MTRPVVGEPVDSNVVGRNEQDNAEYRRGFSDGYAAGLTEVIPPDTRVISLADLQALFYYGETGMYSGEDDSLIDRMKALIGGDE